MEGIVTLLVEKKGKVLKYPCWRGTLVKSDFVAFDTL